MPTTDELVARLERLLDVGAEALKRGDEEAALLALQEAMKVAEMLPRKKGSP